MVGTTVASLTFCSEVIAMLLPWNHCSISQADFPLKPSEP
jgi:hypothetical protein